MGKGSAMSEANVQARAQDLLPSKPTGTSMSRTALACFLPPGPAYLPLLAAQRGSFKKSAGESLI